MNPRAVLSLLAILALLAACGGDSGGSETGPAGEGEGETAAGDQGRAEEPGAPPRGEPAYAGLGSWWSEQGAATRVSSAAEFIAATPGCDGVDAEELERQTRVGYGVDFPLTTAVSEVMLESCAVILDGG